MAAFTASTETSGVASVNQGCAANASTVMRLLALTVSMLATSALRQGLQLSQLHSAQAALAALSS